MIKVNLLNSAVENTNLDVVESAISNKSTQQTLLLLIATGACVLAMLTDFYIVRRDHSRVDEETKVEQATFDRLQPVIKQAKDLQDKNKAVEERINAIMRLRSEQTGPLRLLQLVDGKLPADNLFRLTSVKQEGGANGDTKDKTNKDETFVISGYSPNEAQVTAFAKNIEFSDGWFTKFTVETRMVANPELQDEAKTAQAKGAASKPGESKIAKEAVQFNIRCAYSPQNLLVNPATPNNQAGTPTPAKQAPAPTDNK